MDTPGRPRAWADGIATPGQRFETEEAILDATIELATASAEHGNGPFGAIVATEDLTVVGVGWNTVVETHDSTAHAEINALRQAQARLGTHDLGITDRGPLTLYGSCAPCIQCFGAIYWSGLAAVITAARAQDAERLGFQEGPVTDALWEQAAEDKGLVFIGDAETTMDPSQPFEAYKAQGGQIY